MNHTPTPYTVGRDNHNSEATIVAGGKLVAVVAHECVTSRIPEMRATAAFLVRAANAHDSLVTELGEAVELIRFYHGPDAWEIYADSPEMKRIQSALALAKEGA